MCEQARSQKLFSGGARWGPHFYYIYDIKHCDNVIVYANIIFIMLYMNCSTRVQLIGFSVRFMRTVF